MDNCPAKNAFDVEKKASEMFYDRSRNAGKNSEIMFLVFLLILFSTAVYVSEWPKCFLCFRGTSAGNSKPRAQTNSRN